MRFRDGTTGGKGKGSSHKNRMPGGALQNYPVGFTFYYLQALSISKDDEYGDLNTSGIFAFFQMAIWRTSIWPSGPAVDQPRRLKIQRHVRGRREKNRERAPSSTFVKRVARLGSSCAGNGRHAGNANPFVPSSFAFSFFPSFPPCVSHSGWGGSIARRQARRTGGDPLRAA